jgi:uncharacterized protein (DUF2147 family)
VQPWYAAILVAATVAATPAPGPDPTGEWLVANGTAHIRIVNCGSALWGIVSWQKKPGVDRFNPNPALRSRPTLGIAVLRDMQPGDDPGQWEGEIYNAKNGKTYDSSIELRKNGTLHVEGCAYGILCGGEDWTRLTSVEPLQPNEGGTSGSVAPASDPATAPVAAICTGLGAGPGRSHENRLKQHGGGKRA